VPFGVTYVKIGTIQRRLAWPLHKDDTLRSEWHHLRMAIFIFDEERRRFCPSALFSRRRSAVLGSAASLRRYVHQGARVSQHVSLCRAMALESGCPMCLRRYDFTSASECLTGMLRRPSLTHTNG
ncbi:hypothetical protein AURDEDRAFT_61051, partial [Auricularia subglabra TFB-10046 SS5]